MGCLVWTVKNWQRRLGSDCVRTYPIFSNKKKIIIEQKQRHRFRVLRKKGLLRWISCSCQKAWITISVRLHFYYFCLFIIFSPEVESNGSVWLGPNEAIWEIGWGDGSSDTLRLLHFCFGAFPVLSFGKPHASSTAKKPARHVRHEITSREIMEGTETREFIPAWLNSEALVRGIYPWCFPFL